jgi:hypothetical protein
MGEGRVRDKFTAVKVPRQSPLVLLAEAGFLAEAG